MSFRKRTQLEELDIKGITCHSLSRSVCMNTFLGDKSLSSWKVLTEILKRRCTSHVILVFIQLFAIVFKIMNF